MRPSLSQHDWQIDKQNLFEAFITMTIDASVGGVMHDGVK